MYPHRVTRYDILAIISIMRMYITEKKESYETTALN